MPEDGIYEDLTLVRRRANAVFIAVAVLVFLVLSYYWKIQILEHRKFAGLAEANRTRMRVLAAPRGLILDRNGILLADNQASFKVSIVREGVKDPDASFAAVSRLLGIDEPTLRARVDLRKDLPLFEPIVVADGLSARDVAPIEGRRLEFPELVVESEPQRRYPLGTLAAHVLGYLQERTPEEIRARPELRTRAGEMVGKTGVERIYDDTLRGVDGAVYEVVDSLGRVRGEKARQFPVQGQNIVLNIDKDLQSIAEAALEGREGVVVALDPRTGGILALASYPTYDPNKFITRFTPDEWLRLMTDPLSPLENRAIRGLYAPGSIFKIVMAVGGLGFGFIDPGTTVYCSGSTQIYGATRHCWFPPGPRGHGPRRRDQELVQHLFLQARAAHGHRSDRPGRGTAGARPPDRHRPRRREGRPGAELGVEDEGPQGGLVPGGDRLGRHRSGPAPGDAAPGGRHDRSRRPARPEDGPAPSAPRRRAPGGRRRGPTRPAASRSSKPRNSRASSPACGSRPTTAARARAPASRVSTSAARRARPRR